MMVNCCILESKSDGSKRKCQRPIGTLERDKGFKTCATHGIITERKNMMRKYVQNYEYRKPHQKLKEVYGENQYGEKMFFDTEWFHHNDCGKVKIILFGGGIYMLDEHGEPIITSMEEMRIMLNMLNEAGAI